MLHSSPGPAIELFGGNFMPISFIAGNVAVLGLLAHPNPKPNPTANPNPNPNPSQVLGLLAFKKRLSGALNVALLGLFINFVGLGLEGALTLSPALALGLALTLTTLTSTSTSASPTLTLTLTQARSTTESTTSRSTTASRAAPPTSR